MAFALFSTRIGYAFLEEATFSLLSIRPSTKTLHDAFATSVWTTEVGI